MVRKSLFLIMAIILSITIVGCTGETANTDKVIYDVITKELDKDVDVKIIDTIHLEGKLLVIYMTGNEYQAHEYGYAEFDEKGDKCRFLRTYPMYERGMDLRSAPYKNAYLFVVNNENCSNIQILQDGNEFMVEVEDIPFAYFWGDAKKNIEYHFLNSNGEHLNP
ncbi:MAG: hypothetical protein GXY49_12040 [Syntrophomonadaceae bacterium]|nr:hypothetical protein [Syntrophomonadaceae bacterium]